MRASALVLVLLGVCLLASVGAVDRGKFKTCDKSGFCMRNRQFAASEGVSPYEVVAGSKTTSASRVTVELLHRENQERFLLTITNYANDIVRVRITEKEPLHPRYLVQGALLDDLEEEAYAGDSHGNLIFGQVLLEESPFQLRFFATDGAELVRANARGLFNVEHFRPAPADGDQEAVLVEDSPYRQMGTQDMWEERFQSHTDSKPFGPASVGMDFAFLDSENVYGIPEHASSFSLKSTAGGDPYRLYNLDVFEYELDETMALYGAVPLMIATQEARGTSAAVFWLNAAETWVDIAHGEGQVDTHWFSESGALEFFVLMGPSHKDVHRQYASLTGVQELPPLFAIAYHQCRWNYKDQEDVATVDRMFDEYDIPYDVLWLDIEHTDQKKYFTYDHSKFPQPEQMLAALGAKGRRMVNIVDPHIKRQAGYHVYDGGNRNDLWVKRADGKTDFEGHCWPGASMYLDFTAPAVRDYWVEQFAYDAYKGSTPDLFIWNDMNEPSVFNGPEVTMQKDLVHAGSVEHRDVHNQYGFWLQKATHDGLVARDEVPRRSFVLSRAFFPGSQRYGAIWTGDNAAEWSHLEASMPMLLSVSAGGISFCGADVGGFFGNPDEELLTRWYQAGAYQPFFRAHAHLDTKRREPYLYSPTTSGIIRRSIRARYSLLPYWYTQFYYASLDNVPVMRPLWLEFPTDRQTYAIEDQYLVGADLLVKPVTAPGQTTASVYFPEGSRGWFDVETLQFFGQAGRVEVSAPLEKIPVYQRAGSIIPRKERARRSSTQMEDDPYTLVVALGKDQVAEGELYFDDGISFGYQQNAFARRSFLFRDMTVHSSNANKEGTFESTVLVERIVLLGLRAAAAPTKATVSQQNFRMVVDVVASTSADGAAVYTIRKPQALAAYDWKIELH